MVDGEEAQKAFERLSELVFKENTTACEAVGNNNISRMENIFKTGGIEQNVESAITRSRIAKSSEIQALMEKELKSRRKVILVCVSVAINLA
jgi:hypothetical protein